MRNLAELIQRDSPVGGILVDTDTTAYIHIFTPNQIRLTPVQIGSIASWISSLGTAGSLILGFSILLRDRKTADRAEATRVVIWFVNQTGGTTELFVTNGGSRPTVHVTFSLASVDEQRKPAGLWRMLDVAPVLAPGEGASLKIPFAEFHANILYPSFIQFRDANGISWRRNVRSAKLRRTKVGMSYGQYLRLAKSPRKLIKRIMIKSRYR